MRVNYPVERPVSIWLTSRFKDGKDYNVRNSFQSDDSFNDNDDNSSEGGDAPSTLSLSVFFGSFRKASHAAVDAFLSPSVNAFIVKASRICKIILSNSFTRLLRISITLLAYVTLSLQV